MSGSGAESLVCVKVIHHFSWFLGFLCEVIKRTLFMIMPFSNGTQTIGFDRVFL
jgi:hypothetical protein